MENWISFAAVVASISYRYFGLSFQSRSAKRCLSFRVCSAIAIASRIMPSLPLHLSKACMLQQFTCNRWQGMGRGWLDIYQNVEVKPMCWMVYVFITGLPLLQQRRRRPQIPEGRTFLACFDIVSRTTFDISQITGFGVVTWAFDEVDLCE